MTQTISFSKVLVALDCTEQDNHLLKHTWSLMNVFDFASIHFLYILPEFKSKSSLSLDFSADELQFSKQEACQLLAKEIQPFFDYKKELKISLNVEHGDPQYILKESIEKYGIDLMIVGKKELEKGSGVVARRIARKINASVWFITSKANIDIEQILVPIDFSDNAYRALQFGLHFKEKKETIEIILLHLIDFPSAAFSIEKDREDLTKILKDHAQEGYEAFMQKHQLHAPDFRFEIYLKDASCTSKYIRNVAHQNEADLIIMGVKGDTNSADFDMGSIAEKMVTLEEEIPVLIVR